MAIGTETAGEGVTRWAGWGLAVAALVGVASLLPAVSRTAFVMYDEGVYAHQGALLARGRVPYRDFFAPQPPGILLVGAVGEWAGVGVIAARALNWACAFVLLGQAFVLARRVGGPDAGPFAVALTAGTVVLAYQAIHGATNTPTAALEVAAVLLLTGPHRRKFALAGLTLASATALRLPPLVDVPGLLVVILLAHGRSGFRARAGWFLGGLAVGGAVLHLPLAALVPNYLDNVVGFQLNRARADGDRLGELWQLLTEPAAYLGLPAAVWLMFVGSGVGRAVAAHALLTAVLVGASGNTLSVMYFLPVLPLLAAGAAAAVVKLAGSVSRAAVLVPTVALGLHAGNVANAVRFQMAFEDEHTACVAGLRADPGAVAFVVDGRIADLAGKRLVPGYHATDPNALHLLDRTRFAEWLEGSVAAADVAVVTPPLLSWATDAELRRLRTSGKRLLFDTAATRAEFESRAR